jgi:hypothetical protein
MRSTGALGVAVVLGFVFAAGARAVEVRPRVSPPGEGSAAAAEAEVEAATSTLLRERSSGLEHRFESDSRQGTEDDLRPLLEAVTNGTYDGTVAGKPFELTVAGGKITGWTVEDLDCPAFTVVEANVTTSCNVAGNDTFTCGSLGCSAAGSMRISGEFSGNTVSGTFDADFDPPFTSCCSLRNLSFFATRAGSGGSAPAAPSGLVASAFSDDEVDLGWNDNSDNESEFRVEMRQGTAGAFTDIGGVGASEEGATVSGLAPATLYQFRVRARNGSGDSPYSNTASATTFGGATGCTPSSTVMCLNQDRFSVRATFDTGENSGVAEVVELTSDTGYLWFFSDSNVEAVVKVLNACGLNNRYWVFAGGLTNVNTVITVTDTQTGASKSYVNPQGTPFQPIQDTGAFATCP